MLEIGLKHTSELIVEEHLTAIDIKMTWRKE